LERVGAALDSGVPPGTLDESSLEDLIGLCQYFSGKSPRVARIYAGEAGEALKTLAPWSASRLLLDAREWPLRKSTNEGIPASLRQWGGRVSRSAGLLTSQLTDVERKLVRDSLRLPKDHAELPDSCADEPVTGGELLLRLHTLVDNWLHDAFSISRYVLGFLAGIGGVLIVFGVFGVQAPQMFSATIGLSVLSIAGATYVRRLAAFRLNVYAVAAARAIGNAILGAAALQAVIMGVWTISDEDQWVLAVSVIAVAISLVASVSAAYCAELASSRLAELANERGAATR
jgi:hypothetical protein